MSFQNILAIRGDHIEKCSENEWDGDRDGERESERNVYMNLDKRASRIQIRLSI